MEENKEQKAVEAEVIKENDSSTKPTNKVVEFIKEKKKLLGIVIIAIIAIIVIINLIVVSPKEAVKGCVKAIASGDMKKALKYIDVAGVYVLEELDEDDYDEFWSEYKDFKDSDEYEDAMDEIDDMYDSDEFEDIEDEIKDYDISIKVKKINKVKKVSSHLYKVTAKLSISYEDYDMGGNVDFYVMKDGTKSYIVGFDSDSISDSLLSSMY